MQFTPFGGNSDPSYLRCAYTQRLNGGCPMELVRDLLGHKNIKTTMIYASYTDSKKIQYIRSLQERKVL